MTIDELKRSASDALVVIADQSGRITFAYPGPQQDLGWEADDLLGRPITTIIPEDYRDAHHLGFSRFVMTGKPTLLNRSLRLKVLRKDGTVVDAEHFIVAEREGNLWTFIALIRPLTDRSSQE
jgi:PAS domain S-box-containing protein